MEDKNDLDFDALVAFIRKEIDEYDYPALMKDRTDLVGVPLAEEVVIADLARFRAALVKPYWIDVDRRDTLADMESETPVVERCTVVTDDRDGYLLAYEPQKQEFLLVYRTGERCVSIGVRGDAVGCYLAM
ncbi:MAG: hypothetical protein EOQ39_20980 [Mesorhizobium sp.]|uniref:hypothetical protein n=1 Tax=Mesorhizobium sp. TaxID=1871066 RepID=UPI000FE88E1B|nr:hypothetical protein [Mesorhizobium sp.]RWB07063.1 MAG: hypothetical protein EOQ37_13040 [Mesorhizobium sp.]RWB13039.1 MAG: hypothetical protein EOQ39_20980 [Mesorhizobium sp.]RWO65670.1 MAG: hypothetical protein EOS17_24690 [Mesorhizobium sp.]